MSENKGSSSQQGGNSGNTGNQGKPPSYGTQNVNKGAGGKGK